MPGLRTVHASFGDYLYSRAPSHIRIHQSLGHDALAHACLRLIAKNLRFNISQSTSSYKANLSTKADCITLALEYACLHWAHHVAAFSLIDDFASQSSALDTEIGRVLRSKLMFWLEVLSALGKVGLASGLLLIAGSVVSRVPPPPWCY